jgi:hypothetical protein
MNVVIGGGGIPVVDSNNDDGVGSSGNDDDNHRNHNTKSPPCRCLLLEFLPRELLAQSILGGRYLNGNDLSNFWCAAAMSTKKDIRSSTIEDNMIRIIRHRRTMLTTEEQTTMTMEERNSNEEQDNDQDNEDDNVNNCYYARRLVFRAFEEAITAINVDDDGDNNNDDDDDNNELISSFSFRNFLRLSRQIFGNLTAIEYCENVPSNLIWCGILQFCNKGYIKKEEKIQVVLVTHPRRWSVEQTRLWRNATATRTTTSASRTTAMIHNNERTTTTAVAEVASITVDVIPYNFVPVGPRRGRLVGVTKSDRRSLRQLSQKLDETELVGRFACKNTGRRSTNNNDNSNIRDGGSFNVKLISFAQGQRKLDNTFRQGREPGGIPLNEEKSSMTLRQKLKPHHHTENTLLQDDDHDDDPDDATDNDRNSLLCCWDHDISWDEEENSRSIRIAETPLALRDTMREYNKLCTQ